MRTLVRLCICPDPKVFPREAQERMPFLGENGIRIRVEGATAVVLFGTRLLAVPNADLAEVRHKA